MYRFQRAIWRLLIFMSAACAAAAAGMMKTMQTTRGRRRGLKSKGRQNKGASAAAFNLQERGCYALL